MNDGTQDTNPGQDEWSGADEGSEAGRTGAAREWLAQLQTMIDNAATALGLALQLRKKGLAIPTAAIVSV